MIRYAATFEEVAAAFGNTVSVVATFYSHEWKVRQGSADAAIKAASVEGREDRLLIDRVASYVRPPNHGRAVALLINKFKRIVSSVPTACLTPVLGRRRKRPWDSLLGS